MIKVDNQHVILRVSKRTYCANWKRNLLTIFAIILTTFLIVSVLGIGMGYWKQISERSIKMSGMDFDIELSEPTKKQVDIGKRMKQIKNAGLCVKCAVVDKVKDGRTSKIRLYWVDNICWSKQCQPAYDTVTGNYPTKKDEVVLSLAALRQMGVKHPQIGMKIPVSYYNLTEEKKKQGERSIQFRLCGYYKDFSGAERGYVSKKFYDQTGAKQTDLTQGTLKISLKNKLYSKKTLLAMQRKFAISDGQVLMADEYSISRFLKMTAGLAGLLVLIFITGFLFIYNTLYISVAKDIRYYGQLKTLGMTSIQLKKTIYLQALWNSCTGIPTGLLIGYFVALRLIPMFIKIENRELASYISFEYFPILFVIAALFSVITVFAGCRKPALIAADCSPIEAIRYTEGKSRVRKSKNGLAAMAWRNLFRDKKRAVIVLGSFIVSLTVFFIVNVIMLENDSKRILDQTSSCDLGVSNTTIMEGDKPIIKDDTVKKVKEIPGVKDVRKVYWALIKVPYQKDVYGDYYKELYQTRFSPGDYKTDIKEYEKAANPNPKFDSQLVGITKSEFGRLAAECKGKLDWDEFNDGKFAITSKWLFVSPKQSVGKEVSFSLANDKINRSMRIAAVVEDDPAHCSAGYNPSIIVSERQYKKMVKNQVIESLNIDYKESMDEQTEVEIKKVFKNMKEVSFESKLSRYNDMLPNERKIRILGMGVAMIIAILSILNYVNMMVAGVQNRLKEFSTLESIGMTSKQIKRNLIQEGMGYALLSTGLSIIIATPLSYLVFQGMNSYKISYSIPIISNLIVLVTVMAVCMITPPFIYRILNKGSIMERLRIE